MKNSLVSSLHQLNETPGFDTPLEGNTLHGTKANFIMSFFHTSHRSCTLLWVDSLEDEIVDTDEVWPPLSFSKKLFCHEEKNIETKKENQASNDSSHLLSTTMNNRKSVSEIPPPFQSIFPFPFFNTVQSGKSRFLECWTCWWECLSDNNCSFHYLIQECFDLLYNTDANVVIGGTLLWWISCVSCSLSLKVTMIISITLSSDWKWQNCLLWIGHCSSSSKTKNNPKNEWRRTR